MPWKCAHPPSGDSHVPQPADLATERGLHLGDIAESITDIYPNATLDLNPDPNNYSPSYNTGEGISGIVATGARDRIESIDAGQFPCGE